jgi:hypothetical protein
MGPWLFKPLRMKELPLAFPVLRAFCLALLGALSEFTQGAELLGDARTSADPIRIGYDRLFVLSNEVANAEAASERFRMIVFAVKEELRNHTPGFRPNNYLTHHEYLLLQYVEMLVSIRDELPSLVAATKPAAKDAELAALLDIAQGLAGSGNVYANLVGIIEGGDIPFLRMMAVRSLGSLRQKQAIPLLERLLEDPYFREAADSVGQYRIYLLREEASRALKKLGVKIAREGSNFIVIKK